MMSQREFQAFDLGAESGRAMVGRLADGRLTIEECHRFANRPVRINGTLHWNTLGLFAEMLDGLRAAASKTAAVEGIGVDTWGVDFGILGGDGQLLGNPVHYRDGRTDGMMDEAFRLVTRERIFERTGIQFLPFNTIYQLLALSKSNSVLLQDGRRLLLMNDLFNYFLGGVAANEYSNVSTTQLSDPRTRSWAMDLMDSLDLPRSLFGDVTPPGTVLGPLLPEIAREAGLANAARTNVVASLGHDTAAAVAAVPARGDNWCYISSGTWSLMGAELAEPVITPEALRHNFTNEGGLGGTIRFLENIAGLWLVQQSNRQFAREGRNYTYPELAQAAEKAPTLRSLINPDAPEFLPPCEMATRVAEHCRRAGQVVPQDDGSVILCILESLAMRYRLTLETMQQILGRRFEVIHIVGGGSQNYLLNQMTADCTGVTVVAGPAEATAIGNLMTVALALGAVGSHEEMREVIRNSFEERVFTPGNRAMWDDKYPEFLNLVSNT